jgi:hypothetical protein
MKGGKQEPHNERITSGGERIREEIKTRLDGRQLEAPGRGGRNVTERERDGARKCTLG